MSTKVYDWVAYHARQTPDRLAMIDIHSGRRFTYADMQNRTLRLANGLAGEFGVARGDRVAVLANNTTDFLELEFACLKLGAIFVPLNWRLSVPELEYIVGDAAPGVLVFEDVFEDAAGALLERRKTPALLALNASGAGSPYETLIAEADDEITPADIDHDDVWEIMYTSGTTGHPKGAMITHGMTFWNIINLLNPHRLSANMVNLCALPLFHTGGLNCYCNPAIHMGGVNIIMRSFDPGEALQLISDPDLNVTHLGGVPTIYLFMSQHPSFAAADMSRVITFGVGGAPTPIELIKVYEEKGASLQQAFGMTETSPIVSSLTAETAFTKIGSAGLPVLHTEVRLVDESGVDIKDPDVVGELWVKGPNVTPGYWNRPDADQDSFTDGWLHTGDAATMDEEGYLTIVDRWKDMYISGGENVYPAEIENVIYQLPEVAEVAVIGVADERWGEVGQAVIVVKPDATLDENAVLRHCSERLARFKQPRSVLFMDELPHNATGKVLKRELRES